MTLSIVGINVATAYRLLTLQIKLPSREHILSISDSDSWLEANAFTWVFDATHKLAQTPTADHLQMIFSRGL